MRPAFWITVMVGTLTFTWGSTPPAADVLRSGPSPRVKPTIEALLSGRDCIPLRTLLENRPLGLVHSYSRPVDCGGSQ